jgi:hypothetical protein
MNGLSYLLYYVGYRLVIICSNEEEEKSHIISKLHSCRRPFSQICDTKQCRSYLKAHFTGQVESLSPSTSQMQLITASSVDYEKYVHITQCSMLPTLYPSNSYPLLKQLMCKTGDITAIRNGKVPLHPTDGGAVAGKNKRCREGLCHCSSPWTTSIPWYCHGLPGKVYAGIKVHYLPSGHSSKCKYWQVI